MKELIGKLITSAEKMRKENHDDEGWLKLSFSDGTCCVVVAGYGGYTGDSEDEYPTYLTVSFDADSLAGLIPAGEANG